MILVISADSVRDWVLTVESFDCFEVFYLMRVSKTPTTKINLLKVHKSSLGPSPIPVDFPYMDYPEMDYAAEV